MIEEEKIFDVASLISLTLQHKNNLLDFLDYAYILFSSQDDDVKKERIKAIIKDMTFHRVIKKLESIKDDVENKINYYGDDIGDQLDFDEEVELMAVDIKLEVFEYIGELINTLNEEEEFDL